MKVFKFGGGCLRSAGDFRRAADLVSRESRSPAVVVSAVHGVTDFIMKALEAALDSEETVSSSVDRVRGRHEEITAGLFAGTARNRVRAALDVRIKAWRRLLLGTALTGEVSGSLRAAVLSLGERLSSCLLAAVLQESGRPAAALGSEEIGLVTDSRSDRAVIRIHELKRNFQSNLVPLIAGKVVPVVTGFYGLGPEGKITSLGRNGSDYSAAAVAFGLGAGELEIWKETDGFMTADPKWAPDARPIERLSYSEAAELAYFGAGILHPGTMAPVQAAGIPVRIRNFHYPDRPGTLVSSNAEGESVRSVALRRDVALLRIKGSGIGFHPGILAEITSLLERSGINIMTVLTSRTSINLLVEEEDGEPGLKALQARPIGAVDEVCLDQDKALVAAVGGGLSRRNGVAGRLFSAVASAGINVELIGAGASESAVSFVVDKSEAEPAARTVHEEFFGDKARKSRGILC